MAFDNVLNRWVAIGILHLFVSIVLMITCSTKMMRMRKGNSKKRSHKEHKRSSTAGVRFNKINTDVIQVIVPFNTAQNEIQRSSKNRSKSKTAREIRQHMVVPSTDDLMATSAISVENTLFMPRNLPSIREEPELESFEGKLIEGEVFVPLNECTDNFEVRSAELFPWPTDDDVTEFRYNRRNMMSEYDRELRNRCNQRRAHGLPSKSTSSTSTSTTCSMPRVVTLPSLLLENGGEKLPSNCSCSTQKSIATNS